MTRFLEALHFAKGIDPVADAFASTVTSDVYNMEAYGRILFVIYCGVGTTGTSTITVEACDDTTPTNTDAIPFWYRQITSGDTETAPTRATTSGFTTTAGSSKIIVVEADAQDMTNNYGYIRLKAVESVDSAVLGSVMAIQVEPRYAGSTKASTLS